jgi:serine/threonine-protein kinase
LDRDLYERAAQAAARTRHSRVARDYRVVQEIRTGQSPVLVVANRSGDQLVVKLVQFSNGLLPTCPIAFPSGALNIFPVLDVFAWEGGYGLVMPLAELSLRQWLRSDECCEIEDLMAVLRDVATSLASIEGRMVHGDLKPENILRYQGRWCLADFGPSACWMSFSHRGEYSLTPAYAAPEQWRGRPVTSRTDLYCFGIIAFELLNGVRPFPGPGASEYRRQHLFQAPPPLIGMPPSLSGLIERCLRKDPADRPAAADVSALLETGLQTMAVPGPEGRAEEGGPTVALTTDGSEERGDLIADLLGDLLASPEGR